MAEKDQDSNLELMKKRGIREVSSTSELDSSINTPPNKKKNNKKKNKKDDDDITDISDLRRELKQINQKLTNVMTKDDGSLRTMIRDMIQDMKTELLKSVENKIEILESKLFDKDQENDKLKTNIVKLNKTIDNQKEENDGLRRKIELNNKKATENMNNLEQYGRSNNIRISGLEEVPKENAHQTTRAVINKLNEVIPGLELTPYDIDIAHRLGPKRPNKKRQVIVKFLSRFSKNMVMQNLKNFKGAKLFISEDLTSLNHDAFMCVKYKMSDDIKSVWTRNGNIYYENKTGNIHQVKFPEYQDWFDLPWPENAKQSRN